MSEPADEAALLQRADQPVNAGLRRQTQRLLHFIEGRGDAVFRQALVDEQQKFVLLPGEHGVLDVWNKTGNCTGVL